MEDYLLRHIIHQRVGEREEELPPAPAHRPGTFRKGQQPMNKGRKWDEWMPAEHQERIREQLRRTRSNGNPNWVKGCKAHNAVEVVAFRDGKKVGIYGSATIAARELGLTARNVRHCIEGKRHSCGGYIFFRRDDTEQWLTAMSTHCDIPPGYFRTATGKIYPCNRRRPHRSPKRGMTDPPCIEQGSDSNRKS